MMALKEIVLLCFVLVGVGSSLPVVSDTFSTVQSYNGLDIGTHVYWAFLAPAPDSEGTKKLQFKSSNTDVDLQITVYFNSHDHAGNLVVLNSCTGGSWNGPVWCTGFPFTVGVWNHVLVVVGEDNYEVIVKGTSFSCKYDHYTPPESVETVQITHGRLKFTRVLKNYEPGRVILIHGKATQLEGLQRRLEVFLSDLDLNTYSPVNKHLVLINDYTQINLNIRPKDTSEQTEMVIPETPFKFGEEFTIIIICQTYGYEIIINRAHLATFKHRIPFNEEMRIAVWGTEVNNIEYY